MIDKIQSFETAAIILTRLGITNFLPFLVDWDDMIA